MLSNGEHLIHNKWKIIETTICLITITHYSHQETFDTKSFMLLIVKIGDNRNFETINILNSDDLIVTYTKLLPLSL